MKTKKIKARKGFTIVELVIVIGVIGVLAGVLIPTFVNVQEKAQEAALKSNLANAYSAYVADAADGTVEQEGALTKVTGHVYTIELVEQSKVILGKGTENYTFKNDAWALDGTVTRGASVALDTNTTVKPHTSVAIDVVYGGFSIYSIA